ncbi:MAG: RES superfamily protein [Flavobacteriaceae bacterium CG_4_8_14_3_um_filter_34_10]|nr:RES family NAD+ phosphorylase [Flavobacteriia bacterium]OIP49541.1 MAG: RES superfamily protein [Flavobacteriaceae bacterium CG2_30_34_30]PIQ19255.1 MAG: RES superfamily protein [Flavobacteriaceae bacterium CG18_big_fil_WC_8_21_14_2_50_34_36]PIV48454.1 MAG: RES superfamily protein [Flavobacteriaceae bacterium CG02_land_8_20_14_3_00_34_13]PIX09885.1 MAG: RES superfamily protein [Flavobacteriaceae bacterium CG_4_8_14_3_um_filter_34_10]PIZ08884.1 MAG: RES superfamily protein [Flavobacteriaceae
MQVFRLSRKKYANELSGKGAGFSGNRWNTKGVEMIYCAESRALAMAEVMVHLPVYFLPKDFVMLEIRIPDSVKIKEVLPKELPEMWNGFPHHPKTQWIGNQFIKTNEFVVLKVPSAVVQGDFNFLLNPFHSQFKKIKIISQSPFIFDSRFFE